MNKDDVMWFSVIAAVVMGILYFNEVDQTNQLKQELEDTRTRLNSEPVVVMDPAAQYNLLFGLPMNPAGGANMPDYKLFPDGRHRVKLRNGQWSD